MSRLGFHRMPWIVVLVSGITLFNSWVLFAELVVDRYGLWRFLPLYRRGDLCLYEPLVAVMIAAGLYGLTRRDRSQA